tara:strand:- start:433 stop:957 length:525 start_codon:yes stop_codon:yes gene_type:complete
MFFALFVNVNSLNKRVKKSGDVSHPDDIDKSKLSQDVQKGWTAIYFLTLFAMIFGFITMTVTTLMNEGFVSIGSTTKLIMLMLFFGLGGCAITLALSIGFLIVKWPKTKNPDSAKTTEEVIEDAKMYQVIKPNNIYGIIMTVFFLLPVITILVSEIDESKVLGINYGMGSALAR